MLNKHLIPAYILIFAGIILLLDQMDLIYLTKADIFSYGFIALGIIFIFKGFNNTEKKGLLGGVFFISYGIILTSMRSGFFVRDDEFGIATFFLSLALANFVYFLFRLERWSNFTWGIIFGTLGGLFLLSYYNYYPTWYVVDRIEQLWPLALILFGAMLILKSWRKHDSVEVNKSI